jgi:hypothetical protein
MNINGKNSPERALFGLALCAVAILMALCLIALAVFGVARAIVGEDEEKPLTPTDSQQEQTEPVDEDLVSDLPLTPPDGDIPVQANPAVLGQTADMGQAYLDSMVFFGESTTAHLRSRGVLTDGRQTKQVWADASNTMMLSLEILKKTIIYPETGEVMTVEQAAAKKQPKYVVLAFGVNGLSGFAANQRLYESSYAKLIGAIKAASPQTKVILQTVYPVAEQYANAASVNEKIKLLNGWLPKIAADNGAYLVDTAACLLNEQGMLRAEYAEADGLHLTAAAYREILSYLRTHGCP